MIQHDLLDLYNRDQRIDFAPVGSVRLVTQETIRHIFQGGLQGMVIYSQLTPQNADQIIEREIAFFREKGIGFEWKLYDHDSPPNLKQRLEKYGLALNGEPEALMVLDLAKVPPGLLDVSTGGIRRIEDPSQIRSDVTCVSEAVYGEDRDGLAAYLEERLKIAPELTSIYTAYADGKPACSGWLICHKGSEFAGLWGGSTLPQYRGRGLYTMILAARVKEAVQRGLCYLTIDASPMSRPIVAKYGFDFLTYTYPMVWELG